MATIDAPPPNTPPPGPQLKPKDALAIAVSGADPERVVGERLHRVTTDPQGRVRPHGMALCNALPGAGNVWSARAVGPRLCDACRRIAIRREQQRGG